jgi:hypothetical protein
MEFERDCTLWLGQALACTHFSKLLYVFHFIILGGHTGHETMQFMSRMVRGVLAPPGLLLVLNVQVSPNGMSVQATLAQTSNTFIRIFLELHHLS